MNWAGEFGWQTTPKFPRYWVFLITWRKRRRAESVSSPCVCGKHVCVNMSVWGWGHEFSLWEPALPNPWHLHLCGFKESKGTLLYDNLVNALTFSCWAIPPPRSIYRVVYRPLLKTALFHCTCSLNREEPGWRLIHFLPVSLASLFSPLTIM